MCTQPYREKYDILRAAYKKQMEEWREKVDPVVLRELNRRRGAKGQTLIHGPPRPLSGYMRYVYEYTHLAVPVLSKVAAFVSTYERSTQEQRKIIKLISRLRLGAPRVNGR